MIATVRISKDNQPEDNMSTPQGDDNNRLLSIVNNGPTYNASLISNGSGVPKAKTSNASSALNDQTLL